MHTAFNETKSLGAWVKDPRCVVSSTVLANRICSGMDVEAALTTPKKEPTKYTAFGETKTVSDWAVDERCSVSAAALSSRLRSGRLTPEEAITLPLNFTPSDTFLHDGECKTLKEWSVDDRCLVPEETLRSRIKRGWSMEKALSTKSKAPKKVIEFSAFGERKSIDAWVLDQRCAVPRDTLYKRINKGWSAERAITEPVKTQYTPIKIGGVEYASINALARDMGLAPSTLSSRLTKYGMDLDSAIERSPTAPSSKGEEDLAKFVASTGVDMERGNRKLIAPKELDIVVPEARICIEFNGLFWHSEAKVGRLYHRDKRRLVEAAGFSLIQIWEDDWNLRRPQVKQLLRRKLGVSTEAKIGARSCEVTNVSSAQAAAFFDLYHIQGSSNFSTCIGLVNPSGKLIAVAGFTNRGSHTELVRYATSQIVRGGFSRLVKHYTTKHPNEVLVSFAALDISSGNMYRSTGWRLDKELPPDYMYVWKSVQRKHKFGFRKDKFKNSDELLYEDGLTERQLAALNGLYRTYDSGKLRFVLD